MDEKTGTRRRFLKRAAIVSIIGSIAAGVGFTAFGQGGHGGWHRGGFMSGALDPAQMESHLDRMLKHIYVEIDATEAQKQKLAPIVKAAAKEILPLREQMRAARARSLALLSGESIDRAAIEALRAEQLRAADVASRRLAQAIADVAEVLTPEQRKDLAARFDRSHRRRWG